MISDKPSRLGLFLAELKRRHVWRAMIAYAAAAFVVLQTAEIVLPAFDAPAWGMRVLVLLTLLGLPMTLALAWVYEITPQGIRRTEDLETPLRGHTRPGRMMPRVAFLGLTLATVAVAGWWMVRWTVPEDAGPGGVEEFSAVPAPAALAEVGPIRSLAVLPFESFAEDAQPDYFSAGMHEAVIAQLSQISALRVVSRTSVMRYAGTTLSVPQIARELNVRAVVEGSVLRAGDRVRITVQLIDGRTDDHLWSQVYERELEDVIALQSEVARAIAAEIEAELTPEEETRLASTVPVDPEAYDAYLRGREEQAKGTVESLEEAKGHYQVAVEEDPSFAAAYTALAGTRVLLGISDSTRLEEFAPAVQEARRALELDSSSPEAQAVLVEIQRRLTQRADSLQRQVRIAVPGLDSLVAPNAEFVVELSEFGRQVQEVALAPKVGTRASLGTEREVGMARHLAGSGQYEAAEGVLRGLLDADPNLEAAWDALEYVHTVQGDYEGAVAVRAERVEREGHGAEERAALGRLRERIAADGERGYWEWRLQELSDKEDTGEEVSQVDIASTLVHLGRRDEALDRLERARAERDPKLALLMSDPTWDPLRGEPRFRALLVGLRKVHVRPPSPPDRR
ncbi:MAG: hypothetical protein JSU87_02315 [Gemmatimonadota bacterium]|nr:MAG: hypothetical protein JSU87_02315 [Gemmatimonadota bacterium]